MLLLLLDRILVTLHSLLFCYFARGRLGGGGGGGVGMVDSGLM